MAKIPLIDEGLLPCWSQTSGDQQWVELGLFIVARLAKALGVKAQIVGELIIQNMMVISNDQLLEFDHHSPTNIMEPIIKGFGL